MTSSGVVRSATGPGPAGWQLEFVERVGALADLSGLPPSHVQVFAWLVVCDPPHQSAGQLRETLKLSAGAISMATATLVRMGVVERIAQAGERRAYYRFHPGGWERLMRSRLLATSQMRAIALANEICTRFAPATASTAVLAASYFDSEPAQRCGIRHRGPRP